MSDLKDPFAAAVDDLRALMTGFLDGDWSEIHVSDERGDIFIAREGGGPNPLRAEMSEPFTAPGAGGRDAAPSETLREVTAPHVATLVSILAAGDRVAAGDELARLSVLDEEEAFLSIATGEVAEVCALPGTLVEHGTILVRLREGGE